MGWLRKLTGRERGTSKLEQAPDQRKKRSLLPKRPSKEDQASARVAVTRSIGRAQRRYAAGMRRPIGSNGREKALGEARYLVIAATQLAEQFGFLDEIVNAPGIGALQAKLFAGKPPPPRPQASTKRGGRTSDPGKRRARGWGMSDAMVRDELARQRERDATLASLKDTRP